MEDPSAQTYCALSLLIDPPALAAAITDRRTAPITEYTMVPVITGPGTDMVIGTLFDTEVMKGGTF